MSYQYYDTPDGEDCFKKLWYSTKYATLFGLSASTADVLLVSHPKGYFQTAARYTAVTAPLIGMAATFTVTTCVMTSLRKKDDYLNYFLGGVATGSVFGAVRKSGLQGFVASILLGVAACAFKSSLIYNVPIICNEYKRAYGGVDHYLSDWTLVQKRPRAWKMSEDEDISVKN